MISEILANARLPGRAKIFFWWLFLVALSVGGLAAYQYRLYLSEFNDESTSLLRIASQRIAQHDAHLNALAVITKSSVTQHRRLFMDIAKSILYFYPRIKSVALLDLQESKQLIGSRSLHAEAISAISAITEHSRGSYIVLSHPNWDEHYIMIKRKVSDQGKRYALIMEIDARKLLAGVSSFWSSEKSTMRLTLESGAVLVGPRDIITPQFSQTAGSLTQPLRLDIAMHYSVADLLPSLRVLGVIIFVSLFYLVGLLAMSQKELARVADQAAKLRSIETQLAHASRVNSMGEMASGMAHELTQPMTAILAQSQAGLRLLEQGKINELKPVFTETVQQSRRASTILERLRNWSRPNTEKASSIDLRDALHNVNELLTSEADRKNVQMKLVVPQNPVYVSANQVEMEQVIHNLVKNSFEALDEVKNAQIDMTLEFASGKALLKVSDNGEGVADHVIPNLFVPFHTTRDKGTGLGLTLCQRLVERAGGEVSYLQEDSGSTFQVILPIAIEHHRSDQSAAVE